MGDRKPNDKYIGKKRRYYVRDIFLQNCFFFKLYNIFASL